MVIAVAAVDMNVSAAVGFENVISAGAGDLNVIAKVENVVPVENLIIVTVFDVSHSKSVLSVKHEQSIVFSSSHHKI